MSKDEHQIDPNDLELNQWEFQLVMGKAWKKRELLIENIFCECEGTAKRLVDFKVYLNDINDLVLKGKCSGCNSNVARYIETGEDKENFEAAERIRNERIKGKKMALSTQPHEIPIKKITRNDDD